MPKKQLLLYGLLMGILLLLLEAIQYKVTLQEIGTEIFARIIASVFLALGIWIGMTIYQKKSLFGQKKMKNWVSFMEIFPVGLMVTLIASLVLKKKVRGVVSIYSL